MNKYSIIFTILIAFVSCSKEQKLKNTFVGKVWVMDSIKAQSVDLIASGGHKSGLENILKPIENGEFDVYKDQTPFFSSYKISNDTLFLKISTSEKLEPYSIESIDDYTYKVKALNKNLDNYEYYLTDLTDLFEGKVKNKSDLYESIKGKTWYPIEREESGEISYNESNPEFYIKESALTINNANLEHTYGLDKETLVKITNHGMYFFNKNDNSLVITLTAKIKDNYLEIIDIPLHSYRTKFKKIDKTILKDKKDLPKKVRLNCSETVARLMIEQNVTEYVNSSFYYDVKTIKLVNSDEDNCIYTYSVIYRSRQFSDIHSSHKFKVNYTEDGMVNMEQVN